MRFSRLLAVVLWVIIVPITSWAAPRMVLVELFTNTS